MKLTEEKLVKRIFQENFKPILYIDVFSPKEWALRRVCDDIYNEIYDRNTERRAEAIVKTFELHGFISGNK